MESSVIKATRITGIVVFYWLVSMSLVFVNKWVMKHFDFPYPLFITWIQLLVAQFFIIVTSFLSTSCGGMFAPLEWDWEIAKKVMPLTVVWLLMMASSNICLQYTEVTFYQVARALTIFWSILFQTWEFPDLVLTTSAKAACFVVFVGFVCGSIGEVNFELTGWLAGVISSIFVAYYNNSIKKALVFVGDSSWRLMIYNTSLAIVFFIPFLYIFGELVFFDEVANKKLNPAVWQGIVGSGVLGYLINVAIFLQMKLTSPLTGTISGTVKGVLQVLFGWLLFRNPISPTNGVGIVLVVGGSSWYSYIQYQRLVEKEKLKEAQKEKDIELQEVTK